MKKFISSLWNQKAKIGLSVFCVLIASFDTFWEKLSPTAAAALAVAIVPWVLGLLEKVSAPGGFEIVFAKAERQLDEVQTVPDEQDVAAFKYFESNDPNLAIAMLRVQIERRLRQIAENVMLEPDPHGRPRTLRSLSMALGKRGAIPDDAVVLLNDLMPAMNGAVHGVDLGSEGVEFAIQYGPKILALLKTSEA